MQSAALGWYVQTLTRDFGSEYWLGLTNAMQSLPILLFAAHAGLVADLWPRRWVVLTAQGIAGLGAICFGILVAAGLATLPMVLVFACFIGLTMSFEIPARQALAVEIVGPEGLPSAIGLNSAAFNFGRLLGPAAAGLTMATFGIAACFWMNGLSFLPPMVALALIPLRPRGEAPPSRNSMAGLAAVRKTPRLAGLMGALALVQLTGGSYTALLPALAQNVLGLGTTGFSSLLLANGLGALGGSLWVASLQGLEARRFSLQLGLGLMSAGLLGLGFSRQAPLAGLSLVAIGAGYVIFLTSANSTIQLSIDDAVRGRVMSLWMLVFGGATPFGSYLAGSIAHAGKGPAPSFFVGSLGCAATLGVVHLLFRRGTPALQNSTQTS